MCPSIAKTNLPEKCTSWGIVGLHIHSGNAPDGPCPRNSGSVGSFFLCPSECTSIVHRHSLAIFTADSSIARSLLSGTGKRIRLPIPEMFMARKSPVQNYFAGSSENFQENHIDKRAEKGEKTPSSRYRYKDLISQSGNQFCPLQSQRRSLFASHF